MRIRQVLKYGWMHSCKVDGRHRILTFLDILDCYLRYHMWSNQYLEQRMWELSPERRRDVGERCRAGNRARDEWQRDFRMNRRFLNRYMGYRYELAKLRNRRNRAYAKRYNMGSGCIVEHSVEISRQHYLGGDIDRLTRSIGEKLLS